MPEGKPAIQLRSEEVQEILSAMPGWLIRWGSTFLLVLLLGVLFLAWFIKYPDSITGEAVFTTTKEPIYLYPKIKGNLSNLHAKRGDQVKKGQILVTINNTVQEEQINYLQNRLIEVDLLLKGSLESLIFEEEDISFGAIQLNYNNLKNKVTDLKLLQSLHYEESIKRLEDNISKYNEVSLILKQKLSIAKQELSNEEHKYKVYSKLFEEKVISELDLMDKESNLNMQYMEMQNLKQALVQNLLLLTELHGQLKEKQYNQEELRRKLKESILSEKKIIEAFIQEWKQGNTITAPSGGKVVFIETFSEGHYVTPDKPLFAIVPMNEEILVKVKVLTSRYGKVQEGQKVRLTLSSYPFQEYGYLYGTILQKSNIPIDGEYEVVIRFPRELVSSYGQPIEYEPNMTGTAEIIVEDQRLLERLFYSFRKLLN